MQHAHVFQKLTTNFSERTHVAMNKQVHKSTSTIYLSIISMQFHLTGVTTEIVVTEASTNGTRSCEAHKVFGQSVFCDGDVVRLRKVQILNERQIEETPIATSLVSDGIRQ